jgi:hypothetical protein
MPGWSVAFTVTSKLTGPEQRDGICASVFASANAGTLCRVRVESRCGAVAVGFGLSVCRLFRLAVPE